MANLGSNGGSQHPPKRKAGGHGPTLADEIEHLLPTPTASDGAKGLPKQKQGNGSLTLASTAARLAARTPTSATARHPAPLQSSDTRETDHDASIRAAEPKHLLPTPTSSDGNGGAATTPKRKGGMNLGTTVTRLPAGGANYLPAIRRWEQVTRRAVPMPTVPGTRRLSAEFVEWMMGLPEGWVTAAEGLSRAAQLLLLGNSVVPQQAAHVLGLLLPEGIPSHAQTLWRGTRAGGEQ